LRQTKRLRQKFSLRAFAGSHWPNQNNLFAQILLSLAIGMLAQQQVKNLFFQQSKIDRAAPTRSWQIDR
jgi:hypothetical protein